MNSSVDTTGVCVCGTHVNGSSQYSLNMVTTISSTILAWKHTQTIIIMINMYAIGSENTIRIRLPLWGP